ncbi:MAG: nucleotidyltransferase family protein [Microbacteriaceae bacterium]|nr:MAG: nucleotidyltransferase family protein [Microbacteriaceae bacterium]
MTDAIGLLLAAGAGRRMGLPKALVQGADGLPWAVSAARTLATGGCAEVVVVIGAAAPIVRASLADEPVTVVEATDWNEGMGASLRAGLRAIAARDAAAALVHLVDLPDVGPEVVRRVLAHAAPSILARACYSSRSDIAGRTPGHPVLLGKDHWAAIAAEGSGDKGARAYLARHDMLELDCSDLATGADIDTRTGISSVTDTDTRIDVGAVPNTHADTGTHAVTPCAILPKLGQ